MERLDLDLSRPPPLPGTVEECHRVIEALWRALGEFQQIQARVEELEEQLALGSDNSSQPPSQDSTKKRAERKGKRPTGRKKGAQVGHPRHERALVPAEAVDEVRHYFPHGRCECGGSVAVRGFRPHQVFDLPEIRYRVVEHRVYEGRCGWCGQKHQGRLPDEVPRGQMGPGLVAWIGLMTGRYHLSLREVEALLEEQWGLRFSLGAISQSQIPLQAWLGPVYNQIGEAVRKALIAHADETRHYRGRSIYWLWALTTDQMAYFLTHYSRGKGAAGELLGDFQGILVTDRHGAYNDHPQDSHQYCWAHLIRNLERIAGRKGQAGEDGERLLRAARLTVHCGKLWQQSHYPSDRYRRRLERLKALFRRELEQAAQRHGDNKTGRSCRKLLDDFPRFWTFPDHPGVPMTNNTAERALRPYVIWRKTRFFSQSHRGDCFRPMILSLVETCKRLKIGVYQTLRTICAQGMAEGEVTFRLPLPEPQPLPVASPAG
ncbi:transposase, IS66 family [Methylomarinovum caldicuralii]|uniref:Transposase, IS66 family n=1 Tax=Methylomarinovum caldicuralii TaxID=438856 RepID=A0AAU9BPI5_9GAMM|nr:IS66 family transposase [Methylomarinovum caldicuralii]BCX80613.1 transposase, IS66 family [Methylomarinovum caldicuralii]